MDKYSQLILGNTQAQVPVLVANVRVGRDRRQLITFRAGPLLPFSL